MALVLQQKSILILQSFTGSKLFNNNKLTTLVTVDGCSMYLQIILLYKDVSGKKEHQD
jgi:hypothetical protein